MSDISIHFSQLEGPVCLMGLSGIGKTHLTGLYPGLIIDTDRALDKATEDYWPHLSAYNRRREWRVFCSSKPWNCDGESLDKWADIRKKYTTMLHEYFSNEEDCLILTSEFNFPYKVDLHVGIELGNYENHLKIVGKIPDNGQCESMNYRLEGYNPLIRIKSGAHLSDIGPVQAWINRRI